MMLIFKSIPISDQPIVGAVRYPLLKMFLKYFGVNAHARGHARAHVHACAHTCAHVHGYGHMVMDLDMEMDICRFSTNIGTT